MNRLALIFPILLAWGLVMAEDCIGTQIPTPESVIYPPAVPQPSQPGDLVGFIIQNTAGTQADKHIVTTGQVFIAGQVLPGDRLIARTIDITTPVQLDALSLWPDGSVKFASLALQLPRVCADSQLPAMLAKAPLLGSSSPPLSLHTRPLTLNVTLDFTAGSYRGSQTVDLGKALQTTLATQPDYWLRGPLVTQARVDVPLRDGHSTTTSSLHLTADVSMFSDGSALADVQFNNDLTTVLPKTGKANPQAPLPALDYTATIRFQGREVSHTVSQVQYTAWHATQWATPRPILNIQHDPAYLTKTGAILPYDLTTGVNHALLQDYERTVMQKSDFGKPFASNGITPYMPMTGGRGDIGFTTQYNTVWLLTQDARAARLALAQSDTSGAIPWNYKLTNGHWLTPDDHTNIWVDERGGPRGNSDGIANVANTNAWHLDNAHQPNLNFIPYLMTGSRWNLDRLYAQAAFNLVNSWPGYRCKTSKCNTLLNATDQLRGQAWSFRELKQAAFIAHQGSHEKEYFSQTVSDNWAWLRTQQPLWAAKQGETTGWIPTAPEWQQDFLTGIAVMAALMGDNDARSFVAWQRPWLSGRFIGKGMNPYDGCTYQIKLTDSNGTYLNTWVAIESATVAANNSNGSTWRNSGGFHCALARSALYGALKLSSNDASLQSALSWLENAGAPYTSQDSFRKDPTFNIGAYSPEHSPSPDPEHMHRDNPPSVIPKSAPSQVNQLPPPSTLLGEIRRNTNGQLEAVGVRTSRTKPLDGMQTTSGALQNLVQP